MPQAEVGAGGAHVVGDEPEPHEAAEDAASDAEPEGRLGEGGGAEQTRRRPRRRRVGPEPEPQDQRGRWRRPRPMAWANRLGGPATSRGAANRGATTRVASWPSGLRVGPVSTRAQNP